MERNGSERVPPWLSLASWTFWLAVAVIIGALVLHTLATHRADAIAGARDWHLRVEMCKRLSASPRPPWWECHSRAEEGGENLLAPSNPGDLPDH